MRESIQKALEILRSDEQLLRADKVQEAINVLGAGLEEADAVGGELSPISKNQEESGGASAEAPSSSEEKTAGAGVSAAPAPAAAADLVEAQAGVPTTDPAADVKVTLEAAKEVGSLFAAMKDLIEDSNKFLERQARTLDELLAEVKGHA